MAFRKVFPLICVVVLLCSMLYFPASAATYHLDGVWAFHDSINWDEDIYIYFPFTLDSYYVQFTGLFWDSYEEQLWYLVSDRDEVCVYDPINGWYNDNSRMLTILGDTQLDLSEWSFMTSNGVQVSSGGSGGSGGGSGSGSDPVSPISYSTIVVVAGSVFEFTSSSAYPTVYVYLSSEGLKLVCGEDVRFWYSDTSREFLGLELTPGGYDADFSLYDEYFVVQGSSSNYIFQYYAVYSFVDAPASSVSQVQQALSSFVTFLITPISVFFSVEFIPGLSFGKIALFAFALGLLFWFLKVSK